jgi:uncharacterized RDD family membrane protein YckC
LVALDTLRTAETPEGIALSLRPAGITPRFLAFAIDFAARIAIFLGALLVTLPFGGMGAALTTILYFALEWFYPVVFELGRHGATPGKRMLGLQVVMDSGLPVTPAASITRNLLRAADFLPMVYGFGVASMLVRSDFKRLGDLAAGTLVVHCQPVVLHGDVPPAPPVAPARPLSTHEQASIVEWAGRASRLTPARLDELAVLAQSVTRPHTGDSATKRLLGVAHWSIGHREADRNDTRKGPA